MVTFLLCMALFAGCGDDDGCCQLFDIDCPDSPVPSECESKKDGTSKPKSDDAGVDELTSTSSGWSASDDEDE